MSDTPTTTPATDDDGDKPWYARSSFASSLALTAPLAVQAWRHGIDSVPDAAIIGLALSWATFLTYWKASPSKAG